MQKYFSQLVISILLLLATAKAQNLKSRITVSVNLNGATLLTPLGLEAEKIKTPGTLILMLDLSADGAVTKSTIVSGDADLRAIVSSAVTKWKFLRTPDLPRALQIWVYFIEDNGLPASRNAPLAPPPPLGSPLALIEIQGVSKAQEDEIRKQINAKQGDALTQDLWDRAKRVAKEQRPPLQFQVRLGNDGLPIIRIWP